MADATQRLEPAHDRPSGSWVAIAGHPIHAMLVTFPIALVIATVGCDALYWWTADPFFLRASVWTSGWGFAFGLAAGLAGTVELLGLRAVRHRGESWNHAVAAMLLLAIIGTNWGLRLGGGAEAVFPWGLFLSVLGFVFVSLAAWHGGKLVFEHQIGIMISEDDDEDEEEDEEEDDEEEKDGPPG
ncbi:DUF2231 domain-containing protein [Novispirillum sp. DQ9]|uniref:DUF2231 domain-containing protein n=1 Tax=Novispirillum sp. DQ9 TaxID=3398612 RepID=UPI003C7B459D